MDVVQNRLLIVADDLTGALDTAAPFAVHGFSVDVVADQSALDEAIAGGSDVIAVTTRSREIEPAEAARRVLLAQQAMTPGMRLFKKVDSRLKGNVEAELSVLDFARAVVLPAIPEFGRVVRGGQIRGFGVDQPISVAGRLGAIADRAVIPDTETVEEMRTAVEAITPGDLLVGALSLANALASRTGRSHAEPFAAREGRLLMAIGSRDPITVSQVEELRRAVPDLRYLAAPAGQVEQARHRSERADDVTLVQAVEGALPATASDVAAALAESAAAFAGECRTMLLSGGATAEAYFDRQGIRVLRLVGEVLPGLPVAEHGGQFYITKSGGFGDSDTLCRVVRAMTRKEVLA
ncbi:MULTISPECIES: four-carbon acid sugar kinase family protein [unclassified Sinorhizobium]|uniref:four-carbon acid sugar kinase family protein n=1 Tax=unclassified Sinorhizobium TaxID=2613772 RepID=UPI0024C44918|nr:MULTISPECIES: four-carbon acid sugar kinase family protein [unclassified Sinorhizobium]MDK1373987.1 four-carbon acid sugar kinase family protein [Sinorhizobium sp. 6-70]MDK1477400.1 four-carbon acid sugar kinase family protein [Sinorhizobium sp. 6-117]